MIAQILEPGKFQAFVSVLQFLKNAFFTSATTTTYACIYTVCPKFMDISTSYGQKISSKQVHFKIIRSILTPVAQKEKKGKKESSLFETMCLLLLLNILQTLKSERVALAPMPSSAPLCCCQSHTDEFTQGSQVSTSSTQGNAFGHRYTNQEARTLQDVMPHFGLWNKCIHILMVFWQKFWCLYKMKKTWNTLYRTSTLCTITYKIFKIQKICHFDEVIQFKNCSIHFLQLSHFN